MLLFVVAYYPGSGNRYLIHFGKLATCYKAFISVVNSL